MTKYDMDGWIETHTGRRFFLRDPDPADVNVEDIAHALSHLCRYTGHCSQFYSVAEHSVILCNAYMLAHPLEPGQEAVSREHLQGAMDVLMHDAAEAYVGDVARPLKQLVPDYRVIEAGVERAVATAMGLTYPHPAFVKELDTRIMVDERAQVMARTAHDWSTDGLEPLGAQVRFLAPHLAKSTFLYFWKRLRNDLDNPA